MDGWDYAFATIGLVTPVGGAVLGEVMGAAGRVGRNVGDFTEAGGNRAQVAKQGDTSTWAM